MFYHDLDDLPTDVLPEHLLLISPETFHEAKRTRENGRFLLETDKHFLVMPTPEEAKNHPIIQPLYKEGHLKPNNILLATKKSQDGNYYLPYTTIAKQNIETQMLNFVTLCQNLGAKSIKFTINEKTEEFCSALMDINFKVNEKMNANTGISKNDTRKNHTHTELVTEFEGNSIDLEAAANLINTDIFKKNDHIIAFYNTAKNTNNRIKSQRIKFGISTDISKQLDIFAKTDIPILETIFNAEVKVEIKKYQSLEVEYEVIF